MSERTLSDLPPDQVPDQVNPPAIESPSETSAEDSPRQTSAQRIARSAPDRRKVLELAFSALEFTPERELRESFPEIACYVDELEERLFGQRELWDVTDQAFEGDETPGTQAASFADLVENLLPLLKELAPQLREVQRAFGVLDFRELIVLHLAPRMAPYEFDTDEMIEEHSRGLWRLADGIVAARPELSSSTETEAVRG